MQNVKYHIWGDKVIYLNYNSFQSMWIMYNYIVDWEEFNLINRYVKPEDELGDVGSNIGIYTIWMSKFISSPGKIHCFEPDTTNFEKLKQNIKANDLEQTTKVIILG